MFGHKHIGTRFCFTNLRPDDGWDIETANLLLKPSFIYGDIIYNKEDWSPMSREDLEAFYMEFKIACNSY